MNGFLSWPNSDLDDRNPVDNLLTIADIGLNARRIVRYNATTLNTPYKDGLTDVFDSGLAIISMGSSNNYGTILCIPEGGTATAPYTRKKTKGTWGDWTRLVTNADIKVQTGSVSVRPTQNSTVSFEVIFPEPFSEVPNVSLSPITTIPGDNSVSPGQITTTKFVGYIYRSAAVSANMTIRWTAAGK